MPRWGDRPVTFDRSDSLHSALSKLDATDGSWPYVVLESGCRIADNELTYHLLARTSERFAAPIAVVTGNAEWRQMAREHGLLAFPSIGSLKRARHRSSLSFLETGLDSFLSLFHVSLSRQGLVILASFLFVVGTVAYFLVPVLKVTIRTPVESLTREVMVRVDVAASSVDASAGVVPGRVVENRFSISDFIETTGEKNVGKERAKGDVTIINPGPGLVILPAGTALLAASGQRFTTTASVTVGPLGAAGAMPTPVVVPTVPIPTQPPSPTGSASGASPTATAFPIAGLSPGAAGVILRVPVVAADPGGKGNVPALAINKVEGDAFRGLNVFNEQPLSGGTEAKARVASGDDQKRLKDLLVEKARTQALSELTARARSSESLIPHSMQVRVEKEDYDKKQDEEGATLQGTLSVLASAIAFSNQDINSFADRQWRGATEKGYRALANQLSLTPPEVLEAGERTATLRIKATGRAERVLEIDDLTQELRGMSVKDAKAKLYRIEGGARVESVEMWPDWGSRAYRVEVNTIQ